MIGVQWLGVRLQTAWQRFADASNFRGNRLGCAVFALLLVGLCVPTQAQSGAVQSQSDDWAITSTEQVAVSLTPEPSQSDAARCVAYDFGHVSGYWSLSRAMPMDLSKNFALGVRVHGQGQLTALEIKLTDASGENVWWHRRPNFTIPESWTLLHTKKRQVEFAWGPRKDTTLRDIARIEFVGVGAQGAKGELCMDALQVVEKPEPSTQWPAPRWSEVDPLTGGSGGSDAAGSANANAGKSEPFAISPEQPWQHTASAGTITLQADLSSAREFSGLLLHWLAGRHATRYRIDVSDDGRAWRTGRDVQAGMGGDEVVFLPEEEARYLRLTLQGEGTQGGGHQGWALAGVGLIPVSELANVNSYVQRQARTRSLGTFPRGFSGQQAYWTILGTPAGAYQSLMSEDGAIESRKAGASLEPFVELDGKLLGWSDVAISQSLHLGYMPMPTVHWQHPQFALDTSAFARLDAANEVLVRYRLKNPTAQPLHAKLWLALRPFQVNPVTQFLNVAGGTAPLHNLSWDGTTLGDGQTLAYVQSNRTPSSIRFAREAAGSSEALWIAVPRPAKVPDGLPQLWSDPSGFAAAALVFDVDLQAGAQQDIVVALPQGKALQDAGQPQPRTVAVFDAAWSKASKQWQALLNRTTLRLPEGSQALDQTTRTALAHVLINQEGSAIRPGTRSYARSWIRDGALTGSVLAKLGHVESTQAFADWFSGKLFSNGKVPCCVDERGADPVPENDSMGEYIYLIAETYRFTHDKAWLQKKWPSIAAAAAYMQTLRAQEGVAKNGDPSRQAYLDLLPPSISHEGYSDHPAYSMWDNFWGILGFRDASFIAQTLGLPQEAAQQAQQAQSLTDAVLRSIALVQARTGKAVIPGAADRGDIDPTSATIALAPGGLQGVLPEPQVRATFAHYWESFIERRDSGKKWDVYTPYEWRNVGALVRVGERERALAVSDFLLHDRRPLGWQQWAEVVSANAREPRYLGDMPHGWVSSDFLRATYDMFAYESPQRNAWVLGAGVRQSWLEGTGISLERLHTASGTLSFRAQRSGSKTTLSIKGGMRLPAGGLLVALPDIENATALRLGGRDLPCRPAQGVVIHQLPAQLVYSNSQGQRALRLCAP